MRLSVPPLTASVAAAMARDEEFPAWLASLPSERLAQQEKMRKVRHVIAGCCWGKSQGMGVGVDTCTCGACPLQHGQESVAIDS